MDYTTAGAALCRFSRRVAHRAAFKSDWLPASMAIVNIRDLTPTTDSRSDPNDGRLKNASAPTKRFAARQTDHTKLNDNLGLPDDPPTKA